MKLNEGYVYREQVGARARNRTALAYLTDTYRHSSEAQWRERLERGEVELDGVVAEVAQLLHPGQQLAWHRPPWREADVPCEYQLLHEDEAVLAVVKPSGLPTLPSGGFLHNTLLHLVRERAPGASPLHRLGRATSGVVLFARTRDAAALLAQSFRDRSIEKRYRALSAGIAVEASYEISAPIGLVAHPRLGAVHGVNAQGRASRSTARVLERRPAQTLFEVDLHTGRPEQIRIHLASIGHPLAGDPLYAAGGLPRQDQPGLPGDGGYLLHAQWIAFVHPLTGRRMELYAQPPRELLTSAEA